MALGGWWSTDTEAGLAVDGARSRAAMLRALCLLLLAGGLLALLVLVLPHPRSIDELAYACLGVAALLAAGAVRLAGPRLPVWAAQGVCALGIVFVTLSIYWAQTEGGGASENELIYLWPIIFAAYFFSRRALVVQLGVFMLAYGGLMLAINAGDEAISRWIGTTIQLSIVAALVSYLRTRLDYDVSLQRATIESTTDGILVVDAHGRWESFNRKFLEMWRMPSEITESRDDDAALEFVIGQLEDPASFLAKVRELYDEPEAESYDELKFADGRVVERYSQPQRIDGRVVGRVWSFRDVSDRRRADQRLQHLADHDPLTDLLNRRRFEEELTREVARCLRYGTGGALLLLDLDNFKQVNDSYGHLWGDEVLRGTARLLGSRLRGTDVLARLGGDEFAVLLPEADEVRAVKLAEELLEVVRQHEFETNHARLELTTSVGVVALDDLPSSGSEPLAAADTAMYRAKHEGRDRLAVFEPSRDGAARHPAGGSRRKAD